MSVSRPTSAYSLAFPKAFASWSIPPICCLRLAPTQFPESKQRVTSFRITVIESLGRCFLPGLMGVHTGRNRKRPPRYPLPFGSSLQPDWAGFNSRQFRHSFAGAIPRLMLGGHPMRLPAYRLFTPLYGLRTSRYRRGDAVTTCTCREGLSPSR